MNPSEKFKAALASSYETTPVVAPQPASPFFQPQSLSLNLGGLTSAGTQAQIDLKQQEEALKALTMQQTLDAYDAAISDVSGTVQGGSHERYPTKYGLEPNFWNRLGAANAAMKAAGLGTFSISSGWRSNAEQRKLYAEHVAGRKKVPVARPGTSWHERGVAADLNLSKRQQAWLEANGKKFGIYRIPSESWHWQPL